MNQNLYSPGLHKLLTLEVASQKKLESSTDFVDFAEKIIKHYALESVGIIIHNFEF